MRRVRTTYSRASPKSGSSPRAPWFDELWEGGQADADRLVDLQAEVLALLERIETSTGPLRDEAIVELVDRLRSIDWAVFFRR